MSGWAARHHTAAINARSSADFDAAGAPNTGTLFQSALAFPLIDNDRLVGLLTAYHVDPQPYTDAHLRLLERLGGQAASVLANSIQFEGMRAASLTDFVSARSACCGVSVALAVLFPVVGSNWSECEIDALFVRALGDTTVAVSCSVCAVLVVTVPTVHTPVVES